MPEPQPDVRSGEVSRVLSARAGALAERVAALLESTCSPGSGSPAAAAFLRSWAAEVVPTGVVEAGADHPLDRLVARIGLSDTERDLLLLAGLPDEHEGLAATFRALHPRGEPRPTVGLAALVLKIERAALRSLLAAGPAISGRVLSLAAAPSLFERTIAPAEGLWEALHGDAGWPAGIDRVPIDDVPDGLDSWTRRPVVRRAVEALRSSPPRTLLLTAAEETVVLSRCAALAAAADVAAVAGRVTDDETAALVAVHAAARSAVPVLLVAPSDEPATAALELRDLPGPVIVCGAPGAVRLTGPRPVLAVPIGPIGTEERRRAWRTALPELADRAPLLAARHPLDPALISQVGLDLRSSRCLGGPDDVGDVSELIRARAGVALPAGVELRHPRAGWERLILPAEAAGQLRDAVARLEHQDAVLDGWALTDHARADRGIRLLLTGGPGTGKTLAAEVLAAEAGTELLVVDVSRVVSKWIGETEKNLAALFDAAERTRAVLLLDEADALFGARTEISDAHDRYANLETAYLLQRVDAFDGFVVLATNLRQNVDPAFLRRMDFVIEFPLPDEDGRRALWAMHLPVAVHGADVDLDVLARLYPVTGSWIRNAAIAAAFLAASAGTSVGQAHLVTAMRREYAKASRPFPGEPVPTTAFHWGEER